MWKWKGYLQIPQRVIKQSVCAHVEGQGIKIAGTSMSRTNHVKEWKLGGSAWVGGLVKEGEALI